MGINPNTGTCDKCEEDKEKIAIEFYNKAVDDKEIVEQEG